MRHYTSLLSVLLTFLVGITFFSSCASAQEAVNTKPTVKVSDENTIEESAFNEILAKAAENLKDKTYRLTKTEENFADRAASAESVTTNVLERIPPDKKREIEEVKSPTGNTRSERIWDGKNLYVKENDGEWRRLLGGNSGGGNFQSGRTTITYKFIGKELLNGKTADVYESESHRIANKFTRTSNYQVEYIVKTKYWISPKKLFLKSVKESEMVGSNALTRETSIYEYDAKIKIEAPIK